MRAIKRARSKFRIDSCTRILSAATLFWFVVVMQFALVPTTKNLHNDKFVAQTETRQQIVYVHLGKTGGEFLKSQLEVVCKTRKNPQIKKACISEFSSTAPGGRSPTSLSNHTVGYLHAGTTFPRNAHQLATHYLYSIRHPLHRFASWYVYNHPKSCDPRESNSPSCKKNEWKRAFFEDCFPTIEDIGSSTSILAGTLSDKCARLFWSGWYGVNIASVREPNHMHWNYQFYWNQTQDMQATKKPVLAVRQEFLTEDLTNLESYLTDGRTINTSTAMSWRTADSRHFVSGRVSRHMSDQATRSLCCILQREIQIYTGIIKLANNLKKADEQRSLQASLEACRDYGSRHNSCAPQPSLHQVLEASSTATSSRQ